MSAVWPAHCRDSWSVLSAGIEWPLHPEGAIAMTPSHRLFAIAVILIVGSRSHADRLVVVAGGGAGGDGTAAADAELVAPFGVDFAPDGKTMYFVEMQGGERFRSIDDREILR